MKKQTVWLLVVLLGVFSAFLLVVTGNAIPFQKKLADVGITLVIPANPYNTLASQLDQEQTQLNQEAADLAARQAAFASSTTTASAASPALWYLVVAIAVLAVLVLLNFYFDWRRSRRERVVDIVMPSEPEKPKE